MRCAWSRDDKIIKVQIDLQICTGLDGIPSEQAFQTWIAAACLSELPDLEQTIRIVDEVECAELNLQYRGKHGPTNVLSFPGDSEHLDYQYLGDLVLCAPVVEREAKEQGKETEAHWAHLVVHGMLHLQGFDHLDDAEAAEMEALEIKILSTLGYGNPYNDSPE